MSPRFLAWCLRWLIVWIACIPACAIYVSAIGTGPRNGTFVGRLELSILLGCDRLVESIPKVAVLGLVVVAVTLRWPAQVERTIEHVQHASRDIQRWPAVASGCVAMLLMVGVGAPKYGFTASVLVSVAAGALTAGATAVLAVAARMIGDRIIDWTRGKACSWER